MTSQMTTKVRLVKCPNCRLLLAELPEIPVYRCGGCNIILQAKPRKPDIEEASHDHEIEEHGITEADSVSSFIDSTKDATVSPIDESSAPNTSRCDDNIETMDMKESEERDFFQEAPLSPRRNVTEYEDSLMEQDKGNSDLNPDTGIDNNSEWHQGIRLSDDVPISMELTPNEMEDSSFELQPIMGTEEDTCDTDQYTEAAEIRRGEGKREYFEGSNMSDDVSSVMLDSSPESETHEQMSKSVHLSQQYDSAGSSFAFLRPEDSMEAQREVDMELLLDSKESDPVDDSKSPSDENISVNTIISPDNQHLEPPWKSYPEDFIHESAADPSNCELHAKSPDFVKFPTRSYYACDASVSSYDGMDDLVPTRSSKPPRRKLKPPPSITSEEGLLSSEAEMHYRGYNRSGVNDPMSSESEVQHLGRKATFLEANHITMKYGRYGQDYPQNKDYMQRFHRDLLAGQIKDGPLTNYKGRNSNFVSQDMPLHNEPDKLELLKMINELKDELSRTRISNSSFPARFSGEDKHTGSSYHQSASAGGIYGSQMKGLTQGPRVSRMAYSGETSDYSLRGNCKHCFPQGHNYSSGLPLHGMYSNEAHRLSHNGHKFNKGSRSESSSRELRFQFLQEHQTMSDDRRRHSESENGRPFLTKRDLSSKRYIRSAAGGIPILSCYHCTELLLIPADFLLSGRKCHQLRCNKCNKMMKFSLKSKKHLVPCVPDVVAPPPSVVNDSNDSNGGPVSFSDEYGMSIDRSCSIKSEHLAQHGNLNNKILTAAAFKPFNDQKAKFNMRELHAKHKNSAETIGSTGKGKLMELQPKSGGVLHRLMGYSSPSQVFRR